MLCINLLQLTVVAVTHISHGEYSNKDYIKEILTEPTSRQNVASKDSCQRYVIATGEFVKQFLLVLLFDLHLFLKCGLFYFFVHLLGWGDGLVFHFFSVEEFLVNE